MGGRSGAKEWHQRTKRHLLLCIAIGVGKAFVVLYVLKSDMRHCLIWFQRAVGWREWGEWKEGQ